MPHQVIRFAVVDFQGASITAKPVSSSSDIMGYSYGEKGGLLVAFEDANATFVTYNFSINQGDIVYIYNNVVHVPQHCTKLDKGNTIKCG